MTDHESRGTGGRRRLAAITAVVLGAALLTACGAGEERSGEDPDASTGVTDDSVTIGAHFPLTGVAAPGYSEIPTGAQAYFDYVNANGGVHGREIEYIVRDDGYNPTNTSQVTRELVLEDEIFAMVGGLGTPTHGAVVDYLNSEGVPDLFVSSGSLQWGDDVEAKPYTFGWQPDYESEGKIIGQWVKENMPDARVGLFLQDDDLGRDSEQGIRRYLDDQIVAVERYTSGNTDVAPQIAGLQAANVDLVLGFNTPSYTALSQLVAQKLNFDPQWYYSSIGSDPALVGSLLSRFSEGAVEDGGSAMDGILTSEYIPGIDAPDNEWTKLWQRVWDEYGDKGELTNYRIYGMSSAYAFVQALEAAGEDLTRDGIVDALEEVGTGLEGPQLAPFRYTADSHMGISGVQLVEIRDGVSEPITPVLTTDIGDAPIEEDTSDQVEDAPPDSGIPTG
ncbi:MAG: ABC transporter substrate-binding protein [Nocardioidaceae bacterium]